ncbi:AMIN-like domain-containing (lipo)protein [Actinomyces sp. W5033]|uniref:AMIN-like domain-containing (lipo)protein n=1 Tax=Actinomyces sp. W5033 TaxID=3446479 RepID=UPI003EE243A5
MPVTRRTALPAHPLGAHVPRRTALAALALTGAGPLVACAGPSPHDPVASAPAPSASAGAASPSTSAGSSPLPAAPAATAEEPRWTTGDSLAAPAPGSALVVTGFRVGAHPEEGYDRVVVELTGTGAPGWNARWVEEAHSQGKGEPIDVAGSHTLVVYGTGATMALVEDVPAALDSGRRESVPGGTGLIEADLQLTFEDQFQLTLGTQTQDYRVLTLTGPTRLVVDVRRP